MFRLSEMRKYVRVCLATDEIQAIMVTNRNGIPLWEHLRLLSMNDSEYRYLGVVLDGMEARQ